MKILMVSMNSIHFQRWVNQLEDSDHEIFWFDVYDGGFSKALHWVNQMPGWRYKLKNIKGKDFIKRKFPKFFKKFFEKPLAVSFEQYLLKVQPDCVHSFALYVSCSPIESVMQKYPSIKWVYSSWGSDLFYFKNIDSYLKDIHRILPKIDYLFTDCKRDYFLAKELGFSGKHLGVYPGGGGFKLSDYQSYILPVEERKLILVKGYQNRSGRANTVLSALQLVSPLILENEFEVVVFGATDEFISFYKSIEHQIKYPIRVFNLKNKLAHLEIIKLMGEALVYIGNSNSDGTPNTLLEAICLGAFPIQSNPGHVTEEYINHGINGLLIENCEDGTEIKKLLHLAINDRELLKQSYTHNLNLGQSLDYEIIQEQVLKSYRLIATEITK